MPGLYPVFSWRSATLTGALGLVALALVCQPATAQQIPPAPVRPTVTVAAPTSTAAPETAAKAVEARATAYWQTRQRRDYTALYDFYSSTYRAQVTFDAFLAGIRGGQQEYRDARVADVLVTGNRARVTVAYRMLAPTVTEQWVDSRTDEVWTREADGVWRKFQEPTALPAPMADAAAKSPQLVPTPAFPKTADTPAFPPDTAVPVSTSGSGDGASPAPNRPARPQPTGR